MIREKSCKKMDEPDNPGPPASLERLHTDALVVGLQPDGDLLHVVRATDIPGHHSDNLPTEMLFFVRKKKRKDVTNCVF